LQEVAKKVASELYRGELQATGYETGGGRERAALWGIYIVIGANVRKHWVLLYEVRPYHNKMPSLNV
jgi:hypothetical protein